MHNIGNINDLLSNTLNGCDEGCRLGDQCASSSMFVSLTLHNIFVVPGRRQARHSPLVWKHCSGRRVLYSGGILSLSLLLSVLWLLLVVISLLWSLLSKLYIHYVPSHTLIAWSITMMGHIKKYYSRIGLTHGVMDSLSTSIWRCQYLCRRTKIRIFKSLVIRLLFYGCETWTLRINLKKANWCHL